MRLLSASIKLGASLRFSGEAFGNCNSAREDAVEAPSKAGLNFHHSSLNVELPSFEANYHAEDS